jgi:hypothetical protein
MRVVIRQMMTHERFPRLLFLLYVLIHSKLQTRSLTSPLEEDDDDEDLLTSQAFQEMSKSERKRHREKKRRGEVNARFDALKDIMITINPNMKDVEDINRAELIGRAVTVMRDLFQENEALKRRLNQSKLSIGTRKSSNFANVSFEHKHDMVTVAVPYLVPTEQAALEFPITESTSENRYHSTFYAPPNMYPYPHPSQNYHYSHPIQPSAPSTQSQILPNNYTQEHYYPPSQSQHQYSNPQHDYHLRREDSPVQPTYHDHYPPPQQDYRARY